MTAIPSTASHGFELLREQNLAEINSTARYYRHAKTGAELLSRCRAARLAEQVADHVSVAAR